MKWPTWSQAAVAAYPHWRNALAILTAFCLFIRFVEVAPPRFLTDLGEIDVSVMYGIDVYGEAGNGVSSQFAAGTSRWRWIGMAHLVLTMLVIAATGHHWWLDGIVALALLWVALQLDTLGRRAVGAMRVALVSDGDERRVAEALGYPGDDPQPAMVEGGAM